MNIFFLHRDPKTCATFYFNRHCVKIILEIAQMLYACHWVLQTDDIWKDKHQTQLQLDPYRKTHVNHPTSKWIRHKIENYRYACQLGLELCYEYTRRYGKVHKTQTRLEWLWLHLPSFQNGKESIQGYLATENLPVGCSPIPLAMPEQYHTDNVIEAYRAYYINEKKHIQDNVRTIDFLQQQWTNAETV